MGLIKEPLHVDFEVDPRPLTKTERKLISAFIQADKIKREKQVEKIKRTQKNRSRIKAA
jgi:hypothetical protein